VGKRPQYYKKQVEKMLELLKYYWYRIAIRKLSNCIYIHKQQRNLTFYLRKTEAHGLEETGPFPTHVGYSDLDK